MTPTPVSAVSAARILRRGSGVVLVPVVTMETVPGARKYPHAGTTPASEVSCLRRVEISNCELLVLNVYTA